MIDFFRKFGINDYEIKKLFYEAYMIKLRLTNILKRRKELINHYWFSILRDAYLAHHRQEQLYNPDICYVPEGFSEFKTVDTLSQQILLVYSGRVFRAY